MKKEILAICVLVAIILSGSLSGDGLPSADVARPNVVLLIIDALRADKLGCYGFPADISPELDAIAGKGVQFSRVLSQCSWTRPSIGSMLTSLYPRSIGLYMDRPAEMLNDRYMTLPEILKANGYSTFGITANPTINSILNLDQGFDDYIDSDTVWDLMMGLERGKKEYKPDVVPLPASQKIFKTTLDAMRQGGKRPVYIQINIMEVHEGWRLIRPEFKNRFAGLDSHWYLEAVRQVSFDTDKFIKELLSLPGWENTLFVITSDHGQGLGDHPGVANSKDHGYLLYESQLRVPLIFYSPTVGFKGRKIEQPVRLIDVMPTILDYLGIRTSQKIEGKSLLSLVRGEKAKIDLPPYFIAETYFHGSNKITVYSDKWKYIENRDGQEGVNEFELQEIGTKEDGSRTDRIMENQEVAKEMKAALMLWETTHPKVKATVREANPRERELQQLKSLGYAN